MGEAILIFVLSVAGVFLLWCFWMLWCNQRTYKDVMRLLDWAFDGSGDWQRRNGMMRRVSYDQHMYARAFLRDPWRLYDDEIYQAMN